MKELLQRHLSDTDHEVIAGPANNAEVASRVLLQLPHELAALGLGVEDEEPSGVQFVFVAALLHGVLHHLQDGLRLHARDGLHPIDAILQLPSAYEPGVVQQSLHADSQVLFAERQPVSVLLLIEDRPLLWVAFSRQDVPLLSQGRLPIVDEARAPRKPIAPGEVEAAALEQARRCRSRVQASKPSAAVYQAGRPQRLSGNGRRHQATCPAGRRR
mmetsp:Transcript_160124/g.513756  ORF Transcript_160124/g.513756 Transcript_160124/m.513756 type:complete len:215 (-) Transcript_160124:150-794(-)